MKGVPLRTGTDSHNGQEVTLSVEQQTGYFTGWSGACTGVGSCTIKLNEDKIVTATFNNVILERDWFGWTENGSRFVFAVENKELVGFYYKCGGFTHTFYYYWPKNVQQGHGFDVSTDSSRFVARFTSAYTAEGEVTMDTESMCESTQFRWTAATESAPIGMSASRGFGSLGPVGPRPSSGSTYIKTKD